jgi:hypothetical protein
VSEGLSWCVAGEAPDHAEPIIGWRAWRLIQLPEEGAEDEPWVIRLHSIFHAEGNLWVPRRPFVARCAKDFAPPRWAWTVKGCHTGEIAGFECGCGVYALKRPVTRAWRIERGPKAFGRVALWGRVTEHEHGFRATHAYPLEIRIPPETLQVLRHYQRPSETGDMIDEFLRAYGVPVFAPLQLAFPKLEEWAIEWPRLHEGCMFCGN